MSEFQKKYEDFLMHYGVKGMRKGQHLPQVEQALREASRRDAESKKLRQQQANERVIAKYRDDKRSKESRSMSEGFGGTNQRIYGDKDVNVTGVRQEARKQASELLGVKNTHTNSIAENARLIINAAKHKRLRKDAQEAYDDPDDPELRKDMDNAYDKAKRADHHYGKSNKSDRAIRGLLKRKLTT